jgi:polyisoprenoid-binding protein YceI
MKHIQFILLAAFVLVALSTFGQTDRKHLIAMSSGEISFVSDAPLELIKAATKDFQAVLDTVSGHFAFSVPISSFVGFNSPLQQEHFNENYLESNKYPKATYTGKVIEAWQRPTSDKRTVRTKGKLNIHGSEQETLIPATMQMQGDLLHVKAVFKVKTDDFNIRIPRLVVQKIAQEIDVTVNAYFKLN